MDSTRSMKINRLLQKWPRGTVALHSWLSKQGVSPKLAEQYRKREWIDAVGRGAFVRRGDTVRWQGAVFALQQYAGKQIHPGGRTALALQGYGHFLSFGEPVLRLYGKPGARLPAWFRLHDWSVDVRFTATALFADGESSMSEMPFGEFAILVSSPERAILEYLTDVPDTSTVDEALLLMEGLATLRPGVLQGLLKVCRSVKVKRLFFFIADKAGHPWRKRLRTDTIDLGSGKRVIIRGGRLDTRYGITVPPHLLERGS